MIVTLVFGALTAVLALVSIIFMLGGRKYANGLARVSEKDFPMKRFMPIGLSLQKMLIRLSGNKYLFIGSKDVRRKLGVIYGEHQIKFYSMVYSADALTYIMVLLVVGCLLTAVTAKAEIFLLVLVLEILVVLVVLPKRLDEYIENRRQAIRMEFPDFLSKYILLLGAGMSATEAWETAGKVENADTPFYREVALTNHEITTLGKSPVDALRGFAARLRDSNVSHFVSSVVQYIQYGGGDLAEILSEQSSEAWKNRKQEALRLGETAGTKLTGTMMLMFVGIIIIVMAPALMTMTSGLF